MVIKEIKRVEFRLIEFWDFDLIVRDDGSFGC